jgi:hypothetical protein
MTIPTRMRINATSAALAGLGLRLFFVLRFPISSAEDTGFYVQLARNWLDHGVYGVWINGQLTPIDMRTPGYPAFLAALSVLFGRSTLAVMLAQAVLDLTTCFLIAALAARLAPASSRARAAMAALWLAALCPFTADYTATVLTETLAIFLTGVALLALLDADAGTTNIRESPSSDTARGAPGSFLRNRWFLASIVVGISTFVRPETPLILIAGVLVLAVRWRRPRDWSKLARTTILMGVGFILPLLPWAARNWRTLHEIQFLSPRFSTLPGEIAPRGFYAWTKTWMWRFRDVYLVPWKVSEEPILIEDIPSSAFDSPGQRERVGDLLADHNEDLDYTPEMDGAFAELARERVARHPMRVRVVMPLLRGLAIWFTPRTELLPLEGHLWPVGEMWENDPRDFSISLGLFLLNVTYVGMALAGAWIARRRPGVALLVTFVLVRTAYFMNVETPEPRYVLECYPVVLAFTAQLWSRAS